MTSDDRLIEPTKPPKPQRTRQQTTNGPTMAGTNDKADNNGISKNYICFWIYIIGFAFALKQT